MKSPRGFRVTTPMVGIGEVRDRSEKPVPSGELLAARDLD